MKKVSFYSKLLSLAILISGVIGTSGGVIKECSHAEVVHNVSSEWSHDDDCHWHECSCGQRHDEMSHSQDNYVESYPCPDNDCTRGYPNKYHCNVCDTDFYFTNSGYSDHEIEDTTPYSYDETKHWKTCIHSGCEVHVDEEEHSFSYSAIGPYASDDCTTYACCTKICTVCGYRDDNATYSNDNHDFSSEWSYDENYHYNQCQHYGCSVVTNKVAHIFETTTFKGYKDNDCTLAEIWDEKCCVCGYVKYDQEHSATPEHAVGNTYSYNETHHWKLCTNSGCDAHIDEEEHTFSYSAIGPYAGDDCTTYAFCTKICTVCGYRDDNATYSNDNHDFSNEWSYDENYHYNQCQHYGCSVVTNKVKHNFVTTTFKGYKNNDCTLAELWDEECSVCGYIKYDQERSPWFNHETGNTYSYNQTHHWKSCTHTGCDAHVGEEEHSWDYEFITPFENNDCTNTCLANRTCTVCGYKENGVEFSYNDHDFSGDFCYNDNYHYRKCVHSGCDAFGAAEAHTFVDVEIKRDNGSDCTSDKKLYKVCTTCGHGTFDSLGADYDHHEQEENYRYDASGHYHYCCHENCSQLLDYEYHTYTDVILSTNPCDEEIHILHTCTVCGYSHETIEKGGHDYVFHSKVEATAEHDGCKAHYECSRCHKLFTKRYNSDEYKETTYEELVIKYVLPPKKEGGNYAYVIALSFIGVAILIGTAITCLILGNKKKKDDKNKIKK